MNSWTDELKNLITNQVELFEYLEISKEMLNQFNYNPKNFSLRVPKSFAARMQKNNLSDPLLLQILPLPQENDISSDCHVSNDPLEESLFISQKGVLKKFQSRILVITTHYCPIHCRYCFRRHFDYTQNQQSFERTEWEKTLSLIKNNLEIFEVIFSGGDPLSLPDRKIAQILTDLGEIQHLRVIRFHTRFPIVIPQRFTQELLEILKEHQEKYKQNIELIFHINHAQEIDTNLQTILLQWKYAGLTMRNQAVLLRNINDSFGAQKDLALRCYESGVSPYYLHQFDEVSGAGHFFVPITKGLEIMAQLRQALPGYMVPLYVKEIPHAGSKVPLESYRDKFIP